VRLVDRLVGRLARGLGLALALRLETLHGAIRALYADRRRIGAALALHGLAWSVGVGEAWIGLTLMGVTVGWVDVVILECCAFTLRSAGFLVPGALGVQEGGYVLIAPLVGVPPDVALAVSLLKRGREVLLGAPACLAWQLAEGRGLWCRRAAARLAASE
jgi:uncharacterized membrane protein YbhN (UPF0104 family)